MGPITVEIRTDKKPRRIALAPEGLELKWEWKNGVARVEVPTIATHAVLVLDELRTASAILKKLSEELTYS